jgi:hypothetical protein
MLQSADPNVYMEKISWLEAILRNEFSKRQRKINKPDVGNGMDVRDA